MNDETRHQSNPYATPQETTFRPDDTNSDDALARAFIGHNATYYLSKWKRRASFWSTGFNLPALIFGFAWMGYRKMYRVAGIYCAAIIGETMFEEWLVAEMDIALSDRFFMLTTVVIAVVTGMFANRWYVSHVQRQIERVHAEGHQGETAIAVLKKRGGTSVSMAFVVPIIYMFVGTAAVVLTEIALYGFDDF